MYRKYTHAEYRPRPSAKAPKCLRPILLAIGQRYVCRLSEHEAMVLRRDLKEAIEKMRRDRCSCSD